MEFVAGNRAIRDHAADGKDLLLFETLGKGRPVRFLGTFSCASYEIRNGRDRHGTPRRAIVFHLLPTSDEPNPPEAAEPAQAAGQKEPMQSLAQLREMAYEAAETASGDAGVEARRTYRERSEAVRRYVLARANGICEACQEQAPFLRPNGTPYLEPHHIRRLSDGGPDHPAHVGAICPNCHREIHAGRDGAMRNDKLRERVLQLEDSR